MTWKEVLFRMASCMLKREDSVGSILHQRALEVWVGILMLPEAILVLKVGESLGMVRTEAGAYEWHVLVSSYFPWPRKRASWYRSSPSSPALPLYSVYSFYLPLGRSSYT